MSDDDKFTYNRGDLQLVTPGDGPTLKELAAQRDAEETSTKKSKVRELARRLVKKHIDT